MFVGKLVFAQVMDFLPLHTFRRCVARYPSSYPTKTFSHLDQYLSMAFAQLTFRESLRDIEVCLRAQEAKLYHLGIRGPRFSKHFGRCQREPRPAHLSRFCQRTDSRGTEALRERYLRC